MQSKSFLLIVLAALLTTACETETTTNLEDSLVDAEPETAGALLPTALFDPSNAVIPYPNNLLFAGTEDLTLNIPVDASTSGADPRVALNQLDGFSTSMPLSAKFSTGIDPSSINGSTVRLYEVTLAASAEQPIAGPVDAVVSRLEYGQTGDYIATLSSLDTTGASLAIVPLRPLKPRTSYMVVITNQLMSTAGSAFGPSLTYQLFKSISAPLEFCEDPTAASCALPGVFRTYSEEALADAEGLRQIINLSEAAVAAGDAELFASSIIQGWSFTTQSMDTNPAAPDGPMTIIRSMIGSPATGNWAPLGPSPANAANLFQGTITVPYYLALPSESNPTAILTTPWQAATEVGGENNLTAVNPLPAKVADIEIPIIVGIPLSGGAGGTVIYQHGVTRNRQDIYAVVDALAAGDLSVVAIDIPLHGIADDDNPLYAGDRERTFNLDLVAQDSEGTTIAQGPDGVIDTDAAHFINLQNLVVLRDNLRQAVTDLFAVTAAIPGIDVDGGGADLSSTIYFSGNSLGASIGATFLALEPTVNDAVLAVGGTQLAKVIDGSTQFSPTIVNGLAVSAGITKGTEDYESFVNAVQTAIDSADPVNFASAAAQGRGILFYEIVGGDGSPSDLTIPNRVPDANDTDTGTGPTVAAPLAGGEPMISLMGLDPVDSSVALGAEDLLIVARFTEGAHGSFLSDDASEVDFASAAVTANIRTSMASFLAQMGQGVTFSDDSVLQAAP